MKDEGIGLAGWLLADVVLVLAVFFLALAPGGTNESAPVFEDRALGDLTLDEPFEGGVRASGFPPPEYQVDGSLPPGLWLNSGTGLVSGTPTEAGEFAFTLVATNHIAAGTATDRVDMRVQVRGAGCQPRAEFHVDQVFIENPARAAEILGQVLARGGQEADAAPSIWDEVIALGLVTEGLNKQDADNPSVGVAVIARQRAGEFFQDRHRNGFQIGLVETFVGARDPALARILNNALMQHFSQQSHEFPDFLLHGEEARRWASDFKDERPAVQGRAFINVFFVQPLPSNC